MRFTLSPLGIIAATFVFVLFCGAAEADESTPEPVSLTNFQDAVRPLLVKYCSKCHSPDDEENVVEFLKDQTPDQVAHRRGLWTSVAEQLTNRTMPPGDEPQPSESERLEIARWVEQHLYATACQQPAYAGAPVPRRLNREQYEYAIEDLTGLEFDFVQSFPSDSGGGEGFNNNGEMLFLPPLMMERYLEVATEIIDHWVVVERFRKTYVIDPTSPERLIVKSGDAAMSAMKPAKFLNADQRTQLSILIHEENDFEVVTRCFRDKKDVQANLNLRLDGKQLDAIGLTGKSNVSELRHQVRLSPGPHLIEFAVGEGSPPIRLDSVSVIQNDTRPEADRVAATDRLFAPARDIILTSPRQAAQSIVKTIAHTAWRRPVADDEETRFGELFQRGIDRGEPFAQAIKLPLKAVLVSPHFLFATESEAASGAAKHLTDWELATRLSLFLWHSIPDESLLQLAQQHRLQDPDELRRQVKRMLKDKRSKRFAKSFAGGWLGTQAVGRTVIPDTNFFKPAYSSELVTDLRDQVTETMHWMIQKDRSIMEWLDGDYVVVNHRLAKHYKLESIPDKDEGFEAFMISNSPRTGILGLGAVHMLTSNSQRTSPVLRGGWVLETIFGVQLPAPPPDVGELPGGKKESKTKTVRERLEMHRANPTCAACHDLIDPIGFALENFDVLGRWRDKEGKNKIDAAGKLPSGETFVGPAELREVLVTRKDDFREQLSRKMLGYALGRSLTDADGCTINQVAESTQADGDRMSALIQAVVLSHPFRHRDPPLP